ncbi:hypothetical protein [Nafulsella turpanensis]|uniref:hypothetical protein n=1 Tax=Nafulsella turpanensis TaxID=1265690 RepID=UPI00126787A9|nr:hypothetical protein [Nafulsella turpanensis]
MKKREERMGEVGQLKLLLSLQFGFSLKVLTPKVPYRKDKTDYFACTHTPSAPLEIEEDFATIS